MPQGPTGGILRRQAEREFYYRQLGGTFPLKRLDQLSREYYGKYLSQHGGAPPGVNHVPLEQLESVWLKQYITTQGGTLPVGAGFHPVGYKAALWRQALVVSGFGAQATKNMNDNRYTFYLNN